jgi:hypothetical protein
MALAAHPVGREGGGVDYIIVDEVWTRTEDGWDCTYDTEGLPTDTYPTKEACQQAIDAL